MGENSLCSVVKGDNWTVRVQSQNEAAAQWGDGLCLTQVSADVIRFFWVKYNKEEIRQHASHSE